MKSSSANPKSQSAHGQKTHSAGISNRSPADEAQQQRQLPPQGHGKKDTANRQRSGASAKSRH